jgi:amidohydrolase
MAEEVVNEGIQKYIVSMRRFFHENPELSFKEDKTLERIKSELRTLGLQVHEIKEGGLYSDIVGEKPGKTVAVRADVDALPVTEETEVPFKSKNIGVMHACGHDAHMAMLLGLAKVAVTRRAEQHGTIRLLFQRAEERPPGGAIYLINGGALKGVDYVIGQHVFTRFESGKAAFFYREAMANADEFTIRIHGKGGHGSAPDEAIDALMVASEYVTTAQTIVSRLVSPKRPAVVTFGTFQAGYRYNIIAAHAELTGTVRTFDDETRNIIKVSLKKLLSHLCDAYGAIYEFDYQEGYPAVVNNEKVTRIVEHVASEILGPENILHPDPDMGGEDFAYYLQKVPGTFYFLAVGNKNKGIDSPQHSPTYNVDEDALPKGTEILYKSAIALLSS